MLLLNIIFFFGKYMIYSIVQKSIEKIGNRFDLVLIASYRARQIQYFSKNIFLKDSKNDKPTIISLKEIKNGLINKNMLNLIFSKKIVF